MKSIISHATTMGCFLKAAIVVIMIATAAQVQGEGTTPKIRVIFKGRCEYFRQFRVPKTSRLSEVDCDKVWKAFTSAFKDKNECEVESEDYTAYLNMTEMEIPDNKSLFWSGTYLLSQQYSDDNRRIYTLANTFTGYLVNDLVWCGSETDPSGMNKTDCSSANYIKCEGYHNTAFWKAASHRFARRARGDIFLLLNGSRAGRPAYDPKSYFGSVELPSLQPSQVNRVHIMVATDLNSVAQETCSTGSLPLLKADIKRRGLLYSCVDNPRDIRFLQCVSDPWNSQCKF